MDEQAPRRVPLGTFLHWGAFLSPPRNPLNSSFLHLGCVLRAHPLALMAALPLLPLTHPLLLRISCATCRPAAFCFQPLGALIHEYFSVNSTRAVNRPFVPIVRSLPQDSCFHPHARSVPWMHPQTWRNATLHPGLSSPCLWSILTLPGILLLTQLESLPPY